MLGHSKNYKRPRDWSFVSKASYPQIFVDERNEIVILPVLGSLKPFRIETISRVYETREDDFLRLTIIFRHPCRSMTRDYTPYITEATTILSYMNFKIYAPIKQGQVSPSEKLIHDSVQAIRRVKKKINSFREDAGIVW